MKQKLQRLAMLMAMLLAFIQTNAHDFKVDGIYYNRTSDSTVAVTRDSYSEYSGRVVIPEKVEYSGITYSVTSIGGSAFRDCSRLTSVTIPTSVTSIDINAFLYCSGLATVVIPNSVTSIGSDVFRGCSGLKKSAYPSSISNPFSNGFTIMYPSNESIIDERGIIWSEDKTKLYFVPLDIQGDYTIPNSVNLIGSYAFSACSGLTSVIIPNTVTSIGNSAFSGCSGLTLVTIPNSVTSIGSSAFSGCSGLTSVAIPNSVTSIGDWTFSNCSRLTSVTIPNSVTSIGDYAFRDCSRLTSVTIPNSVTSIGDYAFRDCSGLTSVTIPPSVTSIGYEAFYGCHSLKKSAYPSSISDPFNYGVRIEYPLNGSFIDESGLIWGENKAGLYFVPLNFEGDCSIPNSVTSIGSSAFRDCSGLTSVTIPNSVASIGDSAFYGCSGLPSVTIPNSVTSIGDFAFDECSNLHSITLGSGLLSLGRLYTDLRPEKVIWLANTPPKNYTYLAGKVNYVANQNYNFPDNSSYVYNHLSSMFESDGIIYVPVNPDERTCDIIGCKYSEDAKNISLTRTTSFRGIEMTVNNIRPYAFYGNRYIENLSVDRDGVIPKYAFYGCSNINAIEIPSTITDIYEFAFSECSSASKIHLANIGSIHEYAFSNCSTTVEEAILTIESSVGDINSSAFRSSCAAFTTMDIGNTGSIGYGAFENCATRNVAILVVRPTVTDISDEAFSGCKALTEVKLNNTGSMGTKAFNNSCSLYPATLEIARTVTHIGTSAFLNCNQLTSAVINNTGSLGDYSFENCQSLQEINVRNVGSIGNYAFQNCKAANSLTIAPTVTSIRDYAFYGCSSIADVTIEDADDELSLGSNGNSPLFADCPLDEVYIGRKLSYQTSSDYSYSPFYRNTSLRSVAISDVETQIYDNEFYGCTNLQDVRIGDGVKSFGKYAFSGCAKIESFEFGRAVESIGEEAFSDCTAMVSMVSHNPVPPTCGNEALDDINKWECTLYVPADALDAYKAADQWKNFFFINDDVTDSAYFEYEGLCYRVLDGSHRMCEVVAQEEAPESVRMRVAGTQATNVMIPETASRIGLSYTVKGIVDNAFSSYSALEEVTIPATVEYVGNAAFAGCSQLISVEVKAEVPPTAYSNSFDSVVYANATLTVPGESEALYKVADCWKEFARIEAGVDSVLDDSVTETGRYSLDGRPVDANYRGIVVVRYSDGSTRKLNVTHATGL